MPPLAALAAEGVRWILVEKGTGLPDPLRRTAPSQTARVTHDAPSGPRHRAGRRAGEEGVGVTSATAWGWGMTSVTWLLALGCVVLAWASGAASGAGTVPAMAPGIGYASLVRRRHRAGTLRDLRWGRPPMTPDANPAVGSDDVVRYDAP